VEHSNFESFWWSSDKWGKHLPTTSETNSREYLWVLKLALLLLYKSYLSTMCTWVLRPYVRTSEEKLARSKLISDRHASSGLWHVTSSTQHKTRSMISSKSLIKKWMLKIIRKWNMVVAHQKCAPEQLINHDDGATDNDVTKWCCSWQQQQHNFDGNDLLPLSFSCCCCSLAVWDNIAQWQVTTMMMMMTVTDSGDDDEEAMSWQSAY
jgi:hypothetical protein